MNINQHFRNVIKIVLNEFSSFFNQCYKNKYIIHSSKVLRNGFLISFATILQLECKIIKLYANEIANRREKKLRIQFANNLSFITRIRN